MGYFKRRKLRKLGFYPTKKIYKDYNKIKKAYFKNKTIEDIKKDLMA